MKILTFLHSFEPGGVERIALRLVRHWRSSGIEASLFMGRADGAMAEDVGKDLDFLAPRQPFFDTAAWETLWMMVTLPGHIRQERPDILFCAGNSYTVVAVALKLILGARCPPIIAKISNDLDRRDMPLPLRLLYHLWLRIQAPFLDHVVALADPMTLEISGRMGKSDAHVSVIADPALSLAMIDTVRGKAARCGASAGRHFVTIGRLAPQKKLSVMLEAFALGRKKTDRLTIIGDGPERTKLGALAARLGIADIVEFRGHCAEPALSLRDYDIFLLSSDYEGVPAVIIEALAANLVIIATDCSRSMKALLGHGTLGMLVAPRDVAAMAQAINTANPASQNAEASLLQARYYTIEKASENYLRLFRACLR
ncbi:glycosyltransferase [Sphingobium subterraneum]|uniref:Glycosyltransferase involved in cell wall biosynthesis n=1 Tax=Sphingobium subterraneum TaxID=627688 RepID=A0A841J1B8_9SPHN|nr:glycosyltransferase [Sphingobium subterraneum]MBB6124627.1 glycosyltransferase involved in cell wall biosynthesis [Sphingobium subterraneum]